MKQIKDTFTSELPNNIAETDGYYKWQDLLIKRTTLDDETWETEWLCSRPGLEGIVYGQSYTDDKNLIMQEDWTPEGKAGYLFIAEDFGFAEGHPDAILFCWVPRSFDRIIVFDEMYLTGMSNEDIWEAIDQRLKTYGHNLPDRINKIKGTVYGWVGDYHGLEQIKSREQKGAPMMEKSEETEMYLVSNGISLVRRYLNAGRILIHQRCVNLRGELLSYRFKKNNDGTYSSNLIKTDDHGPDALRYLVVRLYRLIDRKINVTMRTDDETELSAEEERRRQRKRQTLTKTNRNRPITGGMLDSKNWR